jgi:hypothetical protein
MPAIVIEAPPRYLSGFPMPVAVTWENRAKEAEFYAIPALDLLTTQADVRARFSPKPGGPPVEAHFSRPEEPEGITLAPGHAARLLVDLSNLAARIAPGAYELTLTLQRGPRSRSSNIVDIELVAPSDADAAEARRLRKLGRSPVDAGAWAPFLRDDWNTVTASRTLGAEARRALALHLFLHHAAYGPEKVAAIDPTPLAAIVEPSLAAEVAALRYELLAARHDAGARAARDAMLKAYPGLAERAAAVDRGEGEIALLRRNVGAEKRHLKPPATLPYVP